MNQEKYLLALRSLLTLTGEPAKKGESVENLEKLLDCQALANFTNKKPALRQGGRANGGGEITSLR